MDELVRRSGIMDGVLGSVNYVRVKELIRARHRVEFEFSGGKHDGFRLHLNKRDLDERVQEIKDMIDWDREWERSLRVPRATDEEIEEKVEREIRAPVYTKKRGEESKTQFELEKKLEDMRETLEKMEKV